MSISLVGSASLAPVSNTGNVAISYTSSSGNLLVLAFNMADDTGNWSATPFGGVSDSRGNTWHYSTAQGSASPPFDWRNSTEFSVGVAAGIAWTFQDVGTVTSVTFLKGGGTASYDLVYTLSEWSGAASVDAANVSHGTTSGGTGVTSGSITLTDSGDVVVCGEFGTVTGAPAGYSIFSATTGNHTVHGAPGTTGSYSVNWAAANSQDYVTAVVALKAGSVAVPRTFPAAPLGALASLFLGAWTSMTSYIYQRAPVSITRGRADEASTMQPSQAAMTLNNRDNRFTIRDPAGAWYGSIGQNTPFRISVPNALTGGGTYLRMEDDTASYVSCPDSVALQITGTLDVRIDCAPTGWQASSLMSKWGFTGFSWAFYLGGDGTLILYWNNTGTLETAISTQPLPYPGTAGRIALRAVLNTSGQTVTFYTAPNMAGSWTQLGAVIATGSTALTNGAGQAIVVGATTTAPAGVSAGVTGQVYEAQILSGVTLEADPVFTAQAEGASSFSDGTNTWTLHGTAELSARNYRFHGELSSLPKAANPNSTDVYSSATASGIMRRLQQGQSPTNSAMYRAMVRFTGGSGAPGAYWPMEDAAGATQFGPAIGSNPMTFTGTPNLAANSAFACSAPIPVVNGATFNAIPPPGLTWTACVVRFLMQVPSGGDTDGARICRIYTSGTLAFLDLAYGTASNGSLYLLGDDVNGVQQIATGVQPFGVNGELLRVSVEMTVSGGTLTCAIVVMQPGQMAVQATATCTGTIGTPTLIQLDPSLPVGVLSQTALGHLSLATTLDSLYDLSQPLNAWKGEPGGTRFARLCAEEGINCRIAGFPAATTPMGNQLVVTLPTLLQEIETTDMGMMFEPRTCLGLGYVTRQSMYNQAPAVAAAYGSAQVTQGLTSTSDDQLALNDITITNASGSTARQVLTSGPMSVSAPPSGIGRVDTQVTVNHAYDSALINLAGWMLQVRSVNDDRYPAIPFNLARGVTGGVVSPSGVPGLDVGSYLQVTGTPAWLPPPPIRQICAGFAETLGPAAVWTIGVNGVPEVPYEVAAAGSAHAESSGSSLHAGIGSGATSMTVDIASGPLWSTAGGDVPFDILMAGERITVTAISGASSPQTFTITRSVNGVVKAQTAGAAITLYSEPVVGL